MNKKYLIIGGVAIVIIGAIVGLWFAISPSSNSNLATVSLEEADDIDADDEGLTTYEASGTNINFSEYPANAKVKIASGGSYTVSGKLVGKLAVRADDEVVLTFNNAEITNAVGDGINSSGDLVIAGGAVTISAGDDGIHSDTKLTISDGNIKIVKSYEGIEGAEVVINGGTIDVVSDDDGINGAGGNATNTATTSGRGGKQVSSSYGTITVNGGNITIAAAGSGSGDGLDANGPLTITGGNIVIKAPSGARDYEPLDADGTITISGGSVRALNLDGSYTEITQDSLTSARGGGMIPSGAGSDPAGAAPGGPRGSRN